MLGGHCVAGLLALAIFGFCGCAASTNLVPAEIPRGHGAIFGRLEINNNGHPVSERCYVAFSDPDLDIKAYLSLDESGWVFSTTESGPTLLSSVQCTLGEGVAKYPSGFSIRSIRFDVPRSGRIAYFGHLRIDLEQAGTGTAEGTPFERGLQVEDQLDAAVREYHRRYGGSARALQVVDEVAGARASSPDTNARRSSGLAETNP
jgi:hypothetical protein